MEVSKALCLLELSIHKVHPSYIKIDACPEAEIKREQVERSFAYELYHQWSMMLTYYRTIDNECDGLRLNGEVTKNMDGYRAFPDIILHGGQNNLKRQILACEIKRAERNYLDQKKVYEDLDILSSYLSLRLTNDGDYIDVGFQGSVFIVVNIDCNRLKDMLKKTINENDRDNKIKQNAEKIHCFSVELVNQEKVKVTRFKLSEML